MELGTCDWLACDRDSEGKMGFVVGIQSSPAFLCEKHRDEFHRLADAQDFDALRIAFADVLDHRKP